MSRYAKVNKEINDELRRLAEYRDGVKKLYASDVVAAARNKSSPLHNEFEWDDTKAGHEYRLIQARTLIRAVVVIETRGNQDVEVPMWVHVGKSPDEAAHRDPKSREGAYVQISDAIANPDLFARALSALVASMNAAQKAAQELRDAAAGSDDQDRLVRIGMAITALQTAGAAVAALH